MGLRTYSLVLSGTPQRLSDAYGIPPAGTVNAAADIPYRQLLVQAAGATAYLGSAATVTTGTGTALAAGGAPYALGPFSTGPLKLSDLWGVGAGATLQILGVPY